jgi:hypothetical protein
MKKNQLLGSSIFHFFVTFEILSTFGQLFKIIGGFMEEKRRF